MNCQPSSSKRRSFSSLLRALQMQWYLACSGGGNKKGIALSAEVSSCSKSNTHTLATCWLGGRAKNRNFATQKVFIKFKSIMSFCLDFLRNWHLYGTSIWESMSSGRQKKLMKLAGPKVSTQSQKISKKFRKIKFFQKLVEII